MAHLRQAAGQALLQRLHRNVDALPGPLPAWATAEVLGTSLRRVRALLGRWRATPFGAAMDLPWPPEG